MPTNMQTAIDALSALEAKDFDAASIQTLAQLAYWMQMHLGVIWVKTIGRIASAFQGRPELHRPTAPPAKEGPGHETPS